MATGLALVKIRQPDGRKPKYAEAFADRPRLYPGPEAIRPGMPLIDRRGGVRRPLARPRAGRPGERRDPRDRHRAGPRDRPSWRCCDALDGIAAHDADEAGDKAAAEWPARAVRVRPPAPDKDWTEAHQSGVNLRRWWSDRLGGIEAPERSTWDELAARRGDRDGPTRPRGS